jgi:DNA-binding transcriptional LysR family regulator
MVARSFGQLRELLVASPKYLDRIGRPVLPADLAGHTTLSMSEDDSRQRWTLHGPEGQVQKVDLQPTLMAHDFPLLMAAAVEGLGVVLLPELTCAEAIRKGELEVVLPQWSLPQGICHAIYPSRRGLLPAVRVFIDFLAARLPTLIEDTRLKCGTKGGVPCGPGDRKG